MAGVGSPTRTKSKSAFKRFPLDPAFKRARRFPKLDRVMEPGVDGSDPTLQALIRRLGGDATLAKRIISLQQKFPQGTLPELITYDWLMKHGYSFEYQVELLGGWGFHGGLIPDFLIYKDRTNAHAWLTHGNYWHSISRKGFHDQTSNLRMLGQIVNGATIAKVIELWESDILANRPQVYYYALAGISMRGWGGV